jgi:uncharacterized protein YbjQ (UPF0145 family)
VISVLTTFVLPEKFLISLGAIAVHIVIDRTLGEPSTAGTVIFFVGDSKEAIETFSETGKEAIEKLPNKGKELGAAGAVLTACLDVREIFEGKEKVEQAVRDLELLEKRLDEIVHELGQIPVQLQMLDTALKALQQEIASAIVRGNDAAKNYDAIKTEIEKVAAGT